MQFNSLTFIGFFLIFFLPYLLLHKHTRLQNTWLLIASYIFYGLFSWRFLILLAFITLSDFSLGWLLGKLDSHDPRRERFRRILVGASFIINLGLLGFFKYLNFFIGDITHLLQKIGYSGDGTAFNILLPVGLSFYALKSLSYTIDVYRQRQDPSHNLLEYAVFVAFFPALLAGPIDRARKLLPQIHHPRQIDPGKVLAGITLVFSGAFKKLVVADNLALVADKVFQPGAEPHGLDVLLGILAFSVQIYADFSGYTDIARGFARLMGFELMINFKLPYFALNPADFWQRWHISLSEWLRDYIFFPVRRWVLGWKTRQIAFWALTLPPLITMLVSGLWHGTGWNFIFWGLYHGILMILYRVIGSLPFLKNLKGLASSLPGVLFRGLLMFTFVCLGWLFFRASTLSQAFHLLANISFSPSTQSSAYFVNLVLFSLPLLVVQVWQAVKGDLLVLAKLRFPALLFVNTLILVWIVIFGILRASEFIYMQF